MRDTALSGGMRYPNAPLSFKLPAPGEYRVLGIDQCATQIDALGSVQSGVALEACHRVSKVKGKKFSSCPNPKGAEGLESPSSL
jgi:hypothetical protein